MHKNILIAFLLMIVLSSSAGEIFAAENQFILNNIKYSLVVALENGRVDDFLDKGKIHPDAAAQWSMAIVTASKEKSIKIKSPFLRPKPFSKRIEQLKSTLEKRIKNIEYQLKKQHRFDYSSLTGTIICTISAFAFIYSSLCDFAQNYRLNQQYNDLLNELKKNGLQVIDNYNDIPDSIRMRQFIPHIELDSYFSKLPFKYKYFVYPNTPLNKEKIHQLEQIDTKKSNTEIMMLKLEFAIPLLMLASHWFKIAKDPNYDNQYLSKYKQLLKFINHAQKHGYGDESINSVIDIY